MKKTTIAGLSAATLAAGLGLGAASLANAAGIQVTSGDGAELADLIVAATGAAGGLVALLGRISARRRVR